MATVVNIITLYRIIAAPVLLFLLINGSLNVFKWMLVLSFLTDAVDGIVARKFKVISVLGARLDSIGDDLTCAVAVIGLIITRHEFILQQRVVIVFLIVLFLAQLFMALFKYGKISSFHTYLAKIAAILQSAFLISSFFFEEISYPLFYSACATTAIDLIEEIILVRIISQWETDVKGLYWLILRKRREV